ncbi:MAG: hypothetical protein JO115_19545 [Pseudonocardiales bacterium]|nr:hypothetical protein [Pseudonocardiales bacterium]
MRTQDAQLSLAWVRSDDVDADQPPGDSELRMDITYTSPGGDAQLFLTPTEAYQLAEQLLGLYWREHYQARLGGARCSGGGVMSARACAVVPRAGGALVSVAEVPAGRSRAARVVGWTELSAVVRRTGEPHGGCGGGGPVVRDGPRVGAQAFWGAN